MNAILRPHLLCVDDEKQILEGLTLTLRRRYEVAVATSGAQGLEILEQDPSIAVVMSDMRMPGMDGATFLSLARKARPQAVRLLLTGHAELEAAISAVNEGQIFRFLSKPCPAPALMAAVDAAAEQHRLITAEKVLLEQTLQGCIKTLTDMLAIANPIAFGRANRIKQCVTDLAAQLNLAERWQVELAAMFSQLGCITLPLETVEKLYHGAHLTDVEAAMVARIPAVTEQLLSNIPRLETVRAILLGAAGPPRPAKAGLEDLGAQLLRAAIDFDLLEARGEPANLAIDTLRTKTGHYTAPVLDALAAVRGRVRAHDVQDVPLAVLKPGMVIAEDVMMTNGGLLVARGFEITPGLLARLKNYPPGAVLEPVRVRTQAPRGECR